MEVEPSQIVHTSIQVDISDLVDVNIPSEEKIYRPLQRLVKELDLFNFLESLDMDAIIALTGRPKGIRPYTILKLFYETTPYIGFVTKEQDVLIMVSPKEVRVDIELEEAEEEAEGEAEEEAEEEVEETKETKKQLIEKVSANLKTLMSVLYYNKQLLEEKISIKLPIRIENRYKLNVEEIKTLLFLI